MYTYNIYYIKQKTKECSSSSLVISAKFVVCLSALMKD